MKGEHRLLAALFEPLEIAGVTVPNRLMTSAMTLQYGEDSLISDRHLAFYRERAEGGIGLMFSEQLTASPLSPSPFETEVAAYDERQVERFAALAAALEAYPTRFFAQLFGGGVVASSSRGIDVWRPVRGPSAVAAPGGEQALPLSAGEIAQIVADFAGSAVNVEAGGLDGLEVHGSHGWLVGQFLSPFYNRREDRYGGSVENRCRLAIEIGAAIRAAVGADFPVGLTLSYDELIGPAGITEEETLEQLEVLLAAGVYDFYDLSIGSSHSEHHTIASMAVKEGYALDFSSRAKALVGDRAAIFVAGRVTDPRLAARAVRDGATDMIAMSRAHLADPHLARKTREGKLGELRHCVGATVCVGRSLQGQPTTCVLTPATGRELGGWPHGGYERVEPGRALSVMVAGAGPAGLRAGAMAAARGHRVTVFESREEAGGHLADIAWLPTRDGWRTAIEEMVAELRRHGAELRLGAEVGADTVAAEAPDVLLVATGSAWDRSGASVLRPGRDGIEVADGGRILDLGTALRQAREDPGALGPKVVVFDETGIYAPLGLAEALAQAGAEVEVVTPLGEVASDAFGRLDMLHLLPRLRALGVELTVETEIESIRGEELRLAGIYGGWAGSRAGVATVVVATHRLPLASLARLTAPRVSLVGDALLPRRPEAVIEEAERLALAL
ncbi:MAG: NAD(P)-binding protein [Solirubrobacterales bacterium]